MMHSIKMENSPEGFDVEFCSGYGFVASNKTTTNGSLAYLLRCLKLQGSRESVMAFARGVAKTDDLARQHVALMDNKPYGSTKPTDDELTARARAVFDKWSQPAHSGEPVAWYEYNGDLDAWFLAYSHNPKAKTRPLVFGDAAPRAIEAEVRKDDEALIRQMLKAIRDMQGYRADIDAAIAAARARLEHPCD